MTTRRAGSRDVTDQLQLFVVADIEQPSPSRPVTKPRARASGAEHPRALPPTLDVVAAGRLLGVGRTVAYRLVREGRWPTHVVHVGRKIKIPTAPLLEFLGLPVAYPPDPVSTVVRTGSGRAPLVAADSTG